MLVHICCAVDSHYFLQKLQGEYPDEILIGFFYDPNIHPYSEYYLRLLEVRRSCTMLNIALIEGEYDTQSWLEAVRGLEHEPEKGVRCTACFDQRFSVSAQKASELGEKSFTSTLLTSPKKSLDQLERTGKALAEQHAITFVASDYRKRSGTQEQNIVAKEAQLYRQDYCGCLFGLTMQRDEQARLADELFSPLSRQIQPESIEARIELYQQRLVFEAEKHPYAITKERFLNWRLLHGLLRTNKEVVPAHFLPYSQLKGNHTQGRIVYEINGLHYLNRGEVKLMTLEHYNRIANRKYSNVTELVYAPPLFADEINVRNRLIGSHYDLSTIIIVEAIPSGKIEILLETRVYEDVKENLRKTPT